MGTPVERRGRKALGPHSEVRQGCHGTGSRPQGEGHVLARIRKAQEENDEGFPLIELLVVMIIIGILAAIAIPVFLSQRAKAQDSAAKADVSTIGKELASSFVDNTVTSTTPPTIGLASGRYTLTP